MTAYTIPVPLAKPPSASGSADWDARVAAATGGGTITNFNTTTLALYSLDSTPNGNNAAESYVKKSGGYSYRVNILSSDTTLSGEKNLYLFDDEHSLATGEEVYIQFRQYIPAYMIDHVWEGTHSGSNSQSFKSTIVSSTHSTVGGDGSNTNSETVIQGSSQRGYPQGYHQDGQASAIYWDESLSTPCSGSDFKHQPSIDRGGTPSTCAEAIAKYGGLYSDTSGNYTGRGNRDSGAFFWHKYPGVGNWVTVMSRLKISSSGQTASDNEWQVWAAYDGDTSWTELCDKQIKLGSTAIKGIWLECYRSDGSADGSRRNTYTCYDELIVSSSSIAIPSEPTSALKTLADSMAEGDWAELSTTGWDSDLFITDVGGQLLDFCDKGAWDNIGHKAHIIGAGHLDPIRHAIYNEYTNAWSIRSDGVLQPDSHGYNHIAIDVDRRKLYNRRYNDLRLDIYDLDADSYSVSSDGGNFNQVAGGCTYNENLGVVHVFDERVGIMAYDSVSDTWTNPITETSTDTIGPGLYHNGAQYSPTHRATFFGGGNGSAGVGEVDVNGAFSAKNNAPATWGPDNAGMMTLDPVSGDFIFIKSSDSTLYKHNYSTDQWVSTGSTLPSVLQHPGGEDPWNLAPIPIHNYGVIMFCKHNSTGTSGQIYLHKVIQ